MYVYLWVKERMRLRTTCVALHIHVTVGWISNGSKNVGKGRGNSPWEVNRIARAAGGAEEVLL